VSLDNHVSGVVGTEQGGQSVTYPVRSWRPAWRVLALALVIAALPLPALAGDSSQPVAKPGIRASVAKIAASAPLAASASQATTDGKATLNTKSFFKTPAGMIVIAVVGAGAGFAIYSAKHDRIHSVVRSGQ
jgi:hypothetical protein